MYSLYPLTQAGFIVITVIYFTLFFTVLGKAIRKSMLPDKLKRRLIPALVIGFVVWLIFISVLAAKQFFYDFTTMPPKFLIVVIVPLMVILYLTTRTTMRQIVAQIPPQTILYLQSFRIFVEVLLWMLFIDNLLPIQMTFEGRNFDILAGIFGIIVGLIITRKKSPTLLWIYNLVSLGLLVNIVTIAILSTPVPFRVFMNEPANTIVTQFPVVWLPGVLVPLAYTLHILSFKQIGMLALRD